MKQTECNWFEVNWAKNGNSTVCAFDRKDRKYDTIPKDLQQKIPSVVQEDKYFLKQEVLSCIAESTKLYLSMCPPSNS